MFQFTKDCQEFRHTEPDHHLARHIVFLLLAPLLGPIPGMRQGPPPLIGCLDLVTSVLFCQPVWVPQDCWVEDAYGRFCDGTSSQNDPLPLSCFGYGPRQNCCHRWPLAQVHRLFAVASESEKGQRGSQGQGQSAAWYVERRACAMRA